MTMPTPLSIIRAYDETDKPGKKLLEKIYGDAFFNKRDIKELIKSFEDALDYTGQNAEDVLPYSAETIIDREVAMNAMAMMWLIRDVLVGDWEANWDDSSRRKWSPWFKMGSGFGFSRSFCDDTDTFTYAGSRLCYPTEEMSDYAGSQFELIYKKFLTFNK